ncbi:hypothetical protein T8T21_08380 [Limimaricola variabilis]|uniref:hypothetical protein n=1 Tax=Limimaricola variabilis TaxID=1492771 RepID=UPI002AC9BA2A|nr:hypothetical protein [Limimaricola variabilis]WPY93143.1 hypothetical protein T8T21_08380 [Limimaricola variabilis]
MKPLKWIETTTGAWDQPVWLSSPYRITFHGSTFGLERADAAIGDYFMTLEDAQAEAQADYETSILAALSPTPAPSIWRDISTAPKDGRLVLLRTEHGDEWAGTYVAYWIASRGLWFYSQDRSVPRPTHWMPVPPAPGAEAGAALGE